MNRTHFFRISFLIDDNHTAKIKENPYISRYFPIYYKKLFQEPVLILEAVLNLSEEDSGLSDEGQERKGPKNRPKHTRKRIHQAKKNFL